MVAWIAYIIRKFMSGSREFAFVMLTSFLNYFFVRYRFDLCRD
jgi:hypothetical protein